MNLAGSVDTSVVADGEGKEVYPPEEIWILTEESWQNDAILTIKFVAILAFSRKL